jgi:hypothetical protein
MAYIPWWQRYEAPTFAERFELGGLAGKVRKRHAIGLAVPIYTGLAALTGMTMNAAKNYLDNNPEIYNKLASNFDGNMEKLKENISRYIPAIHGGEGPMDPPETESFPDQSEEWAKSFGDNEGTKIPEPEKQKPPVSGDIILPPQLGGSEIPEIKKEDIIFTSKSAEGMLEEDDHSQDKDVLEVKEIFDSVKEIYEARGPGYAEKMNDLNSKEFALKVKEIIDTKYGGTIRNLADDIGIERVRINSLFKKHGIKTDRSGNITQQTIQDLWNKEDKQFLKDFTTNAKYDKNFINNRVEKSLGKDFNKDQFVNWKDLSEIMGIKHRTKKDELKTDSTDLQARLNKLGVKKKKGKGKEVLWHLGDAIIKIQKKSLTKPIKGTGTYHNTKRREFEANTDPDGYKAENKVKSDTRIIIKEVLGENYVPFALEESGHAISINNQLSFEELFKDSNASWISSKIMQDPVLNKEILAARNSIEKGIENSERKQLLILEELLGKEANAENLKAALEAVKIMNQRRENIKNNSRIKKNKFLTDQANRIPLYELTLPKKGETFKSGFLNIDMSSIEPSVSVGKILEINPNAKSFNDLSKKEQALYKENLKNQYIDFATYYYKKRGLDKDDIEDLFDALTEGKEKKADGGLSGVDYYIMNRYK